MSLNIFENTKLDFEVSLIKLDRKLVDNVITDVVNTVVPIAPSAILNLEVTESTLAIGANGIITISNKFNILDELDITTNSPNDLYVAIKIVDTELASIDIPEEKKVITVVGLVNSTSTGSLNVVDNIVTFIWEEAFVAATRKTQLEYFASRGTSLEQLDVLGLAEMFNSEIFKLKTDDKISVDAGTPNVLHDLKNPDAEAVSVYDAMHNMLKESTVGERNTVGKVSYCRFVNQLEEDGSIKRKLKYDAFLSDRHIELVNAIKTGESSSSSTDFSDVYTEKFSIGPLVETAANNPNINTYNKIETYNISRADVGPLRESIWGNYYVTFKPSESSNVFDMGHSWINTNIKTFADITSDFITRELAGNPFDVNIPLLDPKEIKEFQIEINTLSDPIRTAAANIQQENLIVNTVIKSFLTINETISFTVRGSVIRQPNMFIGIERSGEEEDYKKLWYVNHVTHKFGEGKYTTDIIATKIFGDTTAADIGAAVIEANTIV